MLSSKRRRLHTLLLVKLLFRIESPNRLPLNEGLPYVYACIAPPIAAVLDVKLHPSTTVRELTRERAPPKLGVACRFDWARVRELEEDARKILDCAFSRTVICSVRWDGRCSHHPSICIHRQAGCFATYTSASPGC